MSSTEAQTQNKKRAATLLKSGKKDKIDEAVEDLKKHGIDAKAVTREKDPYTEDQKRRIKKAQEQLRALRED